MKKAICLFLGIFIMFSSFIPTFAKAEDTEVSSVLQAIKPRIPDTESYDKFTANSREYNGSKIYEFEWYMTDGNDYLSVTVNEENIITGYYVNSDIKTGTQKPSIKKLSNEDASKKALDLALRLNPMLKNKIEIVIPDHINLYSDEYGFEIKRIENGIDVKGNNGYITLNKNAETILHFNMQYSVGLNFGTEPQFISYDEARNAYEKSFGMKPVYNMIYEDARTRKTELVYVFSHEYNTYINAADGSVYTYNPYQNSVNSSMGGSLAMKGEAFDSMEESRLSEAEVYELDKISHLRTADELKEQITSNKLYNIDKNCIVKSVSLTKDIYDKNRYYYYFNFSNNDNTAGYNITADAACGQVISYNRYNYNQDRTKEYNFSDNYARKIAEKLFADVLSETSEFIINDEKSDYVSYKRVKNGIECTFDGINVSLNKYDGKIDSFRLTYTDVEFVDKSNMIDTQRANEILFDNVGYNIYYLPDNDKSVTAVYDFEYSNISVNAIDSKINIPSKSHIIPEYTDIDNHYAQKKINELRKYSIGFDGGEFLPESKINQGEYLTLLSSVFSGGGTPIVLKDGYDYSYAYSYAKRNGLIADDEVSEDAVLTRETACIMLVKAMGYDEVAKFDDIFVSTYNDVSDSIGYVAILTKLGVVSGDGNGNFVPERELTRAEAAVMIYNYLAN